jgi:hypothetical protein
MPEPGELVERLTREQEMARIGMALHDLCQPLTTLQCRLEMAQFVDTPEAYREAVVAGLLECERLAGSVGLMRQALRAATRPAADVEIGAAR